MSAFPEDARSTGGSRDRPTHSLFTLRNRGTYFETRPNRPAMKAIERLTTEDRPSHFSDVADARKADALHYQLESESNFYLVLSDDTMPYWNRNLFRMKAYSERIFVSTKALLR